VKLKHLGLWALTMALAFAVMAASSQRNIESVLDRLEQRLMDQDRESLSFGEEPRKGAPPKGAATRFQYPPQDIVARDGDERELIQVTSALAELDQNVDAFAGEVQRFKQKILEEVAVDNFVSIAGTMEKPDAAVLRMLRLKVDGFTVYTIDEATGLWLPRAEIPFFSGPLMPGAHKVELEARLGRRRTADLPVADDTFQAINRTFDINMPDGKVKKSWLITIKAPDPGKARGDAVLAEKKEE